MCNIVQRFGDGQTMTVCHLSHFDVEEKKLDHFVLFPETLMPNLVIFECGLANFFG